MLTTPPRLPALCSWDRLREAAAGVLQRLPSPLPGLEAEAQLTGALCWALALLDAPRCREADAGARLLRLLAHKYVARGGWRMCLTQGALRPPLPAAAGTGATAAGDAAMLDALGSSCALVEARLSEGEADLPAACRRGLAAGPLLALHLLAEEAPWGRLAAGGSAGAARAAVARMLALAYRTFDLVLPTLSRPEVRGEPGESLDGLKACS